MLTPIQNINILNHYIGMKYIVPDSIPELKYFPFVVVAFVLGAWLVAWLDKRRGYLCWIIIVGICLCLAMYDFYLWEYDYGHSLDPNAIMKFEGESFQPPLIGSKTLLNFVAKSYPHVGGYAIILSYLLMFTAYRLRVKRSA